jgi:hypothetical protein
MRRRAAVAVLVAVGLFAAVQLLSGKAADTDARLRDPAFADKFAKLERLKCERPTVVLGSSRTLLGFHAARFEQATGTPAFNFGTPATGPITHLVYLNRLLERGITPGTLLLEVLPPMLFDGEGGPIEQAFLSGERLTGEEVAVVEGFGFRAETVRPKWRESVYAPWYSLRCQVVGRVAPSWLPWNHRYDWGRKTDSHGWATPPRQSVTDDERAEHVAKAHTEYAATLAGLNPQGRPLDALKRIVETCRERGVPVVLVLMPEATTFRAMYPVGLDERIGAELAALAVPLIDARNWLDDADFYDGHHPFTRGAERFTDELAKSLPAGEKR